MRGKSPLLAFPTIKRSDRSKILGSSLCITSNRWPSLVFLASDAPQTLKARSDVVIVLFQEILKRKGPR